MQKKKIKLCIILENRVKNNWQLEWIKAICSHPQITIHLLAYHASKDSQRKKSFFFKLYFALFLRSSPLSLCKNLSAEYVALPQSREAALTILRKKFKKEIISNLKLLYII